VRNKGEEIRSKVRVKRMKVRVRGREGVILRAEEEDES
jgi:hypothetical protein